MIRKIQCFVMALCLLLTAAFGLGVPMTVSAAETDDLRLCMSAVTSRRSVQSLVRLWILPTSMWQKQ